MQLYRTKAAPQFYVYAMFCQEDGAQAYVKIGRTQNLRMRLAHLKTGCPVPVRFIAYVETETFGRSVRLEEALHKRFADRNSAGEWFRFNLLDKDEQAYFNDNCRWVFAQIFKENAPWWSSIDEEELREAGKEKQRRGWWCSKKGRRLAAIRQRQARDATELKKYRHG